MTTEFSISGSGMRTPTSCGRLLNDKSPTRDYTGSHMLARATRDNPDNHVRESLRGMWREEKARRSAARGWRPSHR